MLGGLPSSVHTDNRRTQRNTNVETWRNTNASTCAATTPGHMTDSTLGCRTCLSNDTSVCLCAFWWDYFWSSLYYHFLWREIKTLWRLCFSLQRESGRRVKRASLTCRTTASPCVGCVQLQIDNSRSCLARSQDTTMHAQKHWEAVMYM